MASKTLDPAPWTDNPINPIPGHKPHRKERIISYLEGKTLGTL